MRRSIKLLCTILLFLLLLTSLRLLWMKNLSPEINLGASEAGMMDLSTFSADEEALYPLVGEWLYFSDELLTTEEIKAKRDEAQIKTYPQDWMEESVKKDYNYGTFYTELSMPDDLLDRKSTRLNSSHVS